MPSRPTFDWREAADYDWLSRQDRSAWAWEWLRRDPLYRQRALEAIRSAARGSMTAGEPEAEIWGLHRFEDPRLDARRARPMWTAAAWSCALRVAAKPAKSAGGFDIMALGDASMITGTSIGEHWLEFDDGHSLRLDVTEGTLARGPVRLWLELRGPREIRTAISALRQLAELWCGRDLPAGAILSPARAARLLRLLRVADALAAGASQRSIAEILFNPRVRAPHWRFEHASVRLQAQRAVRNARAMTDGGYRRILSGAL
jgi:hypothetical protein